MAFTHEVYEAVVAELTLEEQAVCRKLAEYMGREWWVAGAHPQTIRDYVTAYDEVGRRRAMRTMVRDGLTMANRMRQAFVTA